MNTIHVISPFHSRLLKEKWSHCAFTQIALKQIQIFKMLGYHVIDYSNWGSESVADEHVEILSKDEFLNSFLDDGRPAHGNADIGSPQWQLWNKRLLEAFNRRMTNRQKAGKKGAGNGVEFVAHTFGSSAEALLQLLPDAIHFESHIGYDRPGFGPKRVFVSEAWRNYLWGKYGSEAGDHRYSWVVHPYYDVNDWPPMLSQPYKDGPVSYLGRMTADKGLSTVVDIAARMPHLTFELAGSGMSQSDFQTSYKPTNNVIFLGEIPGSERATFYGRSSVLLVPSEYMEPCAGVVCEAALCGTPSVASSWGGFKETIIEGMTGYTAATLSDWIHGVELASLLLRKVVMANARARFKLEAAAVKYDQILETLMRQKRLGWYDYESLKPLGTSDELYHMGLGE